jgi:sigma-E factor negative regulatory protein RseB
LLLITTLVLFGQTVAADSARQWLDGMSTAMKALDYDGTFVYQHGGKLEAMRIIHRVDDGGQRERLVSLTGSAREVLRDGRSVTCILPDNKSVMVGQSRPPQPFPVVPEDLGAISRYYQLEDEGEERMIGYLARVIAVTPKDEFRYGYRFWIDRDSRMLLKSDLTGVDGKPVEQVMFTTLEIGIDIPAADLQPSLTGEGYTWLRQTEIRKAPDAANGKPGWTATQLPAGFMPTDFQRSRMREQGGDAEHMVYSDGMATVSVYVEEATPGVVAFTGLSSMGAMNAYGIQIDGFQITVVGEVPPATVRMIATSVERRNRT